MSPRTTRIVAFALVGILVLGVVASAVLPLLG
jgi:hypothetical protein